jgi:hypothetical protein
LCYLLNDIDWLFIVLYILVVIYTFEVVHNIFFITSQLLSFISFKAQLIASAESSCHILHFNVYTCLKQPLYLIIILYHMSDLYYRLSIKPTVDTVKFAQILQIKHFLSYNCCKKSLFIAIMSNLYEASSVQTNSFFQVILFAYYILSFWSISIHCLLFCPSCCHT